MSQDTKIEAAGHTAFPSLDRAYATALYAAEQFYDAACYEETLWTGWGEQTVPPEAEMRRVKAKQALDALRDAQGKAEGRAS